MSKVAPAASDKKSNKVSPDALAGGNDFLNDPDINPVIEGDEE